MAGMTTVQLLAELDITYRQLDHWLRTGVIRIAYDANGSGSRRWITGPECDAIRDVCREHARIEMLKARLRSGDYFAASLAHHHDEQNRTTTPCNGQPHSPAGSATTTEPHTTTSPSAATAPPTPSSGC